MTTNEAKKLIKSELVRRGIPFMKLTAKTIDFTDLARKSCIFVTIHGWQPNPQLKELKDIAARNGFRVNTDWYISG